jgi:outer membrane protein
MKFCLVCLFLCIPALSLGVQPASPGVATSSSGVTLAECYQGAKAVSETLGISDELIRLAQEQYRTQLGAVLPRFDWIKQQFYQDKGGASGGGGTPLRVQPLSYFQLIQPIFAGLRDWTAIHIAESFQNQSRFNRMQADLDLLTSVAAAFYNAVALTDTLEALQETRRLTADRINELNRRVAIGRSRESEVLSAQTQLATIDAQIEDARRSIAVARQLLYFLTKVPTDVPLLDTRPDPTPFPLEEALVRSEKRPDLLSTEEALRQAQLGVRLAKGAHWPILGFMGKYYTERVGSLSEVRWDANFLLDVPIYSGGGTQAQVRAARSQEIIARLSLARLQRDIERQVRSADEELSYSVTQTQAYKKALELAQKNYEAQGWEYRLGLINNLEVLQVLTDMQNVRQQWVLARASAKLNEVRLRIAMGEGL